VSYSELSSLNQLDFVSSGCAEWYVIRTKPRAEELARNALAQYDICCYLPKLFARQPKTRTPKVSPLFPGYLFFQLDKTSRYWSYVRWAPGVSYVLSEDQGPLAVPGSLIEEIASREEKRRQEVTANLTQPFRPAEPVQVLTGPLAGLDAVFNRELSPNGRVQILVQLLGRLTAVDLDVALLERVN
jgi:transcriptional antiterminator RfaH